MMKKMLILVVALLLAFQLFMPFTVEAATPHKLFYQASWSSPVTLLGDYNSLWLLARDFSNDSRGGIYTAVLNGDESYYNQLLFGLAGNEALNATKTIYLKSGGSTPSIIDGFGGIGLGPKINMHVQNVTIKGSGINMKEGSNLTLEQGTIVDGKDSYRMGINASDDCKIFVASGVKIQNYMDAGIFARNRVSAYIWGEVINNGIGILGPNDVSHGGVFVGDSSTVVLYEGGKISGNIGYVGGGICAYAYPGPSSTVVVDGVVENNYAWLAGGGVYLFDGKLSVSSTGIIRNNSCGDKEELLAGIIGMGGGGINAIGGEITVFGTVESNKSAFYGGGISLRNESSLTLFGGASVANNQAEKGDGGGIFASEKSKVVIYGGRVSNNQCQGRGGGICIGHWNDDESSTLNMSSAAVVANNEAYRGGGIHGSRFSTLNIAGAVENNKASSYGGGIEAYHKSILNISQSGTIRDNEAGNKAGGIYLSDRCRATVAGKVQGNRAKEIGGIAVYYYSSFTLKDGGLIRNNKATTSIGGLALYSNSEGYVDGKVDANQAENGNCGGIAVYQSYLKISNSGAVRYNKASQSGGGVYIDQQSTAEIAGTIESNTAGVYGGGIYAQGSSKLVVGGGRIINNKVLCSGIYAAKGGGIYAQDTELSVQVAFVNGNKVLSDRSSAAGGGIALGQGMIDATVSGCQINNNIVQGKGNDNAGGGIWVGNSSSLILSGSTLQENSASALGDDFSRGGGLEVYHGGAAKISDCTFLENYADTGGIMANYANQLHVNRTNILSNEALKANGGGVMAYYTDGFLVENSKLANNLSRNGHGGGLAAQIMRDGTINNCELLENEATGFGGGIYLSEADLLISNCAIKNNSSGDGGGGLYTVDSNTALKSNTVSFNTTGGDGGGFSLNMDTRGSVGSTLSHNSFYKNSAGKGGGGLSVEFVDVTMDSDMFEGNTASWGGAVSHLSGYGSRMDIKGCSFVENKAGLGGAIYNWDCSYEDPADSTKYQDLSTDWETEFVANEATMGLMEPPQNWAKFDNLKYKTLSAVTSHPSILNNYDINYMREDEVYYLTYEANNGTGTNRTDSYPYNVMATLKGIEELGFSYLGYYFKNWNDRADGTGNAYDAGGKLFMDYHKTVYAQWEEGFVLTYDANGGTGGPYQETTPKNTDVTVKTIAETGINRDSHRLTGWNTQRDGGGTAYQPGDILHMDADKTLYAQWEEICCLSYRPNGGFPRTIVDRYYPMNTDATVEDFLYILPGFVLDGYNTMPDGTGDTYYPGDTLLMNQDKVLYAHWKKAYNLVYYQTEYILPPSPKVVERHGVGSVVALKNPDELFGVYAGYIFAGWKLGKMPDNPIYQPGKSLTITRDIHLYGQWKRLYTLTYDANNTTGQTKEEEHADGESFEIKAADLLGFTYPGYRFVCWNTEADGSGTDVMAGESRAIYSNQTLYAKWGKEYTLTYDTNGGAGINKSEAYDTGGTATVKGAEDLGFTRSGYSFAGWNTKADGSGTAYGKGATLTMSADIVLFAQWKKQATLLYDANGGGGIKHEVYDIPSDVVIKTEKETGFAQVGFAFTGWNTLPDGTGTDYAPGVTVTLKDDLVLYAQWKEEFTLTYKANGGKGADVVENYLDGQDVTVKDVTAVGFTRAGFVFAGWNTAADGSGTGYKKEDKLPITSDVTLYARWQASSSTEPTPTYSTIRVPISGKKLLQGGGLKANQFTFVLKDSKNKVLATVANGADGSFFFPDRTFSKEVKDYTFTVHEAKGSDSSIIYDEAIFTIRVTTKAVSGHLEATVTMFKDGVPHTGPITFTNCPKTPPTGDDTIKNIGMLLGTSLVLMVVYLGIRRRRKNI